MDALVYEESPLSEYLESQSISEEPSDEAQSEKRPFVRSKLLDIRHKLRDVRRRTRLANISQKNAFLEQFRYLIIASRFLDRYPKPWQESGRPSSDAAQTEQKTLSGAITATAISFAVVAFLRGFSYTLWRQQSVTGWSILAALLLVALAVASVLCYYLYSLHRRRRITNTLANLLQEWQALDHACNSAIRHIQEVEVVSRGYDLSSPLPPVTRLESFEINPSSNGLRVALCQGLRADISECIDAHNAIHPHTVDTSLAQYHEIYEVSLSDFFQAVTWLNGMETNFCPTLKDLRILIESLCIARKVILCDLLALAATAFLSNDRDHLNIADVLTMLLSVTRDSTKAVEESFEQETSSDWSDLSREVPSEKRDTALEQSPCNNENQDRDKQHLQIQIRRMASLADNVRALNARMNAFRHTVQQASSPPQDTSKLSTLLTSQHQQVGAELRSLLGEWEQGKRSMFLNVNGLDRHSGASSGLRSPVSPSPSLGGLTMVEDGPNDALRALNGDEAHSGVAKLSDLLTTNLDEEVFEAVSSPLSRKRHSMAAMSREERMTKIAEDRRKRATLQEHQDRTTNMLRELEMVIKHRPRGRTTSRAMTVAV